MSSTTSLTASPKTWDDLGTFLIPKPDKENGPTNPQATLRLFGQSESDVRVTLYRDHHAWCPYCQKIWLYLEEHKIPYRVRKVTMFCYGDKESWYRQICPSGMLPALEIDNQLITESDVILMNLDHVFGPIESSPKLDSDEAYEFRRLERKLFGAWCDWLCRRHMPMTGGESRAEQNFKSVASEVDAALAKSATPFFLDSGFSITDIIFTPYIERMSASLTYYKSFSLRANYPNINKWFNAMEQRETYLGTQSDFHTHSHDLPPQMGMCVSNGTPETRETMKNIDTGIPNSPHFEFETSTEPKEDASLEALTRCYVHREQLIDVNPSKDKPKFDEALRCALTYLATDTPCAPPKGTAPGLRYLRDRVSVPRDMSLHAGRKLRLALEVIASLDGEGEGPEIRDGDRRDQNPVPFVEAKVAREGARV